MWDCKLFPKPIDYMVEVCPAWAEHRRVLREAIGGSDLSHPALVEAVVRGGEESWEAVTSFCGSNASKSSYFAPRERDIIQLPSPNPTAAPPEFE